MLRSLAISFLAFPFSALAFLIGWAVRDLRSGLLAGAVGVIALQFLRRQLPRIIKEELRSQKRGG